MTGNVEDKDVNREVDNDTIVEIVTNVKFATATESKENIDIAKADLDLTEDIALDEKNCLNELSSQESVTNSKDSKDVMKCEGCHKTFKSKKPYEKHTANCIEKYSNSVVLECKHCGKIYKTRKPYEKHILTHNTDEIENLFDENDMYQEEAEKLLLEGNSSLFEKSVL